MLQPRDRIPGRSRPGTIRTKPRPRRPEAATAGAGARRGHGVSSSGRRARRWPGLAVACVLLLGWALPAVAATLDGRQPLAGARVANFSPGPNKDLNIDLFQQGVVVLEAERGGQRLAVVIAG